MANTKISELSAAASLVGTEQVPVVQGGATVRTTINAILALLSDAAPGTLDTLNELAAALGDDANFAATMTTALGLKADSSAMTTALALKAPLASPTFSGTVTLPNSTVATAMIAANAVTAAKVAADVATQAELDAHAATAHGGGMSLIADLLLGSPAATIDFTAIPGTYKHLRLVGHIVGTGTPAALELRMTFNNDAGTYFSTQNKIYSASSVVDHTNAYAFLGYMVGGAAGVSGRTSAVLVDVPNYAGTVLQKSAFSNLSGRADAALLTLAGHNWNGTAAINQITFSLNSDTFATGSRISLYGMG